MPAALQLPQGWDRSQRIWHSSAEISLTNGVDSDYLANFACFTLFVVSVRLNAALQGYSSRYKNYSSIRTNLVAQSLEKRNVVSEENEFSEFTITEPHQNLLSISRLVVLHGTYRSWDLGKTRSSCQDCLFPRHDALKTRLKLVVELMSVSRENGRTDIEKTQIVLMLRYSPTAPWKRGVRVTGATNLAQLAVILTIGYPFSHGPAKIRGSIGTTVDRSSTGIMDHLQSA